MLMVKHMHLANDHTANRHSIAMSDVSLYGNAPSHLIEGQCQIIYVGPNMQCQVYIAHPMTITLHTDMLRTVN